MPKVLTYGICCPGHSLWLYKTSKTILDDKPDFLIAVNGAILLDLIPAFDFWAVQDIEVFETVYQLRQGLGHNLATLWIPDRWLTDIPKDYDRLRNFFNSFLYKTFPSDKVEQFNNSMPFAQHINWREYTMFMAIGLAIKSGAKIINLYGADLAGTGYGNKGLENSRTQHTARRWQDEADKLELIRLECKAWGITLNRKI